MLLGALSNHWQLAIAASRRWARSTAAGGVLVFGIVFTAVYFARAAGWLERGELAAYDALITFTKKPLGADDRIVIIGITEGDLRRLGHPLNDRDLARLLRRIAAGEPSVIGLDVYRDLPEPRSGEGYSELESALREVKQVIAITKIAASPAEAVPPPPALVNSPDPDDAFRIASNNTPRDPFDGVCRRSFLFVEDYVDHPLESLALALAREYLAQMEPPIEGSMEGNELVLGKTKFPRLPRDAGGYTYAPLHGYEVLLDYRASVVWSDYVCYSAAQVLDDLVPPGAWRGKIVLIATLADSVKDDNKMPNGMRIRGVANHASNINHILRAAIDGDAPLNWWPEHVEVAWIAAAVLAGGALGFFLRSPWLLLPAAAFGSAAILLASAWYFARNIWIPVVAPLSGYLLAVGFATSWVVLLERDQRIAMRSLFSKHVSREIAETLWRERDSLLAGGRLRPQQMVATVLFTDLKGFSTTSETRSPEELMAWMNEYFERVARHVGSNDGIINKFIGDAIMAVFGCPVVQNTPERIASAAAAGVDCALGMERELRQLNAMWTAQNRPTMEMRIGIHTGTLVSGSVGSTDRLEWTVLGDTVNTAARLESAGKDAPTTELPLSPATILISNATYQHLGTRYDTRCLGPISLKGKSERVIVHRVVGVRMLP